MNRETIASLEQQARALDAIAVHVLFDGDTLLDVGDTARPVRVHSVRKSLISALYGVAYDQGVVDLGTTLGEVGIEDTPPLTGQEKSATIEDLLTARSGVYLPPPEGGTSFLPPRGAYAPGTHWVYNNWDFNVLGNIYERLTHKSLYIAFHHHFARPLGFTDWQLYTHSSYEYRADPLGGNLRYPNYTLLPLRTRPGPLRRSVCQPGRPSRHEIAVRGLDHAQHPPDLHYRCERHIVRRLRTPLVDRRARTGPSRRRNPSRDLLGQWDGRQLPDDPARATRRRRRDHRPRRRGVQPATTGQHVLRGHRLPTLRPRPRGCTPVLTRTIPRQQTGLSAGGRPSGR